MAEKVDLAPGIIAVPPIYNLDVDTLWKIFWMNTDMFDTTDTTDTTDSNPRIHYPMDDLRRTSQVCRFWREVALGSPVLWGQVIELDGLRHRIQWGRELVARAALAPLCIKGTRRWEHDLECRLFFHEILDQHWCRIQKLDILMHTPFREKLTGGRTMETDVDPWEPLRRPAPLLERFSLISYHPDSRILSLLGSDGLLFAHRAPRLHTFGLRAFRTPVIFTQTVILQAPWLRQLRALVIASSLFPTEVLAALANMHLLESLDIKDTIGAVGRSSWDELEQHDTIILPSLHQLNIKATFYAARLLLKCVQPSAICSLNLMVNDTYHIDYSPEILRDMADRILRYIQALLTQHHTLVIKYLGITEHKITIHLVPLGCKSSIDYVNITILPGHPTSLSAAMISHLLAALLSSHHFTHIDLFCLAFRGDLEGPVEEGVSTILSMLFSSLHSVTRMQISKEVFQLMLEIPPNTQSAQIQTLEIENGPPIEGESEFILRFLRGQVEAGKAVGMFSLPWRGSSGFLPEPAANWRYLEEIRGLKVVWGDGGGSGRVDVGGASGGGEYICGSGTPEKLDFDVRPPLCTTLMSRPVIEES